MTYKNGFLGGLGTGFFAWLISEGVLVFAPNPTLIKNLVFFIAGLFFVLTVILGVAWVLRNKSSGLGTTGDGFVYGFTTVFDILYIVTSFLEGKMPSPSIDSIFFMIL
jgi:hypothetical protein